jgi:hypothetical protein
MEYIKAFDHGRDLVALQMTDQVPRRADVARRQCVDFRGCFLHAVLAEISHSCLKRLNHDIRTMRLRDGDERHARNRSIGPLARLRDSPSHRRHIRRKFGTDASHARSLPHACQRKARATTPGDAQFATGATTLAARR